MKKVKFAFLLIIALLVSNETISQTAITYGETITGTISVDGEVDAYIFSGNAGDKVIIRMTESTASISEYLEPYIELYNPAGELIEDTADVSQVGIYMELPATGSYTLLASDNYPGDDAGNYAVFIQRTFDPGVADTLHYGETAAASISTGGEIDSYVFSGNAGDKVIIRMTESTASISEYLEPYIELYNPAGELIEDTADVSQVGIYMELPATGSYTLLASDNYPGDDAGNYAVFIQRTFDPGQADTLHYGETVAASISTGGEIDSYVFSGNAGDKVIIRMTESTAGISEYLEPHIELYGPTGENITESFDVSQANITYTLKNSGYYTILACDYYPGDDNGDYAIYLFGFDGSGPGTNILSYSFGIPPQTREAIIDQASHTVAVEVEEGTDVTGLIAIFELSEGATANVGGFDQQSGVTANDFTSSVTYKITAEDGISLQDWIVTIDIATVLPEKYFQNIKIYPNPFSYKTTIEFNNPDHSIYKLSVYNLAGRRVYDVTNITSNKVELLKSDLQSGIYLFELIGNEIFKGKLIKQ